MNKHTNREKKINLNVDLHKWKEDNQLKCRPSQMKRKKDNLLANMSRQTQKQGRRNLSQRKKITSTMYQQKQ